MRDSHNCRTALGPSQAVNVNLRQTPNMKLYKMAYKTFLVVILKIVKQAPVK